MRSAEFQNWDSGMRIVECGVRSLRQEEGEPYLEQSRSPDAIRGIPPSRVLDFAEPVLSTVEGLPPGYFALPLRLSQKWGTP